MKTFELNAQAHIPIMGLGTSQLRGSECTDVVTMALELGYRHIDTADMYGNHEAVGEALKQSGIPREEIFLVSKVGAASLHRDDVLSSCERYLEELQTEYLDLFLIHHPNRNIPIRETLEAMEELRQAGKIRAIGVSNFTPHHIEDALETGVQVTNNQVELRPGFNQQELREFSKEKGIILTAYAPLGRGADLETPLLHELAEKYGRTVPQIILSWVMGHDVAVIPKTSSRERLLENLEALEITLEKEDVEKIDALPQGERLFSRANHEFDY